MPIYRYEAIDSQGQLRRGAMDASSQDAVRQKLSLMGFQALVVVDPKTVERASAGPAKLKSLTHSSQTGIRSYTTSRLPLKYQVFFWRQLAQMAGAGIAPYDMFQTLGVRAQNSAIKRASVDVAARIKVGSSVADAMAMNGDVFGTDFRMAVMAGELGGFTHDVYNDLALALEEEYQHRNRWRWVKWLYTPLAVLGIIAISFTLKMTSVFSSIQKFAAMAGPTDTTGPSPEVIAYCRSELSGWLRHGFVAAIGISMLIFIGWPKLLDWLERGPLRPTADAFLMRIPLLRKIKILRVMGRFYRMLRCLVAAGVTPLAAWDAASESVGNHAIAALLLRGRDAILAGQGFGAAIQRTHVTSHSDIEMLLTGDQSGRVSEMLKHLEDDYQSTAESLSKFIRITLIIGLMLVVAALTIYVGYLLARWYGGILDEVIGWSN